MSRPPHHTLQGICQDVCVNYQQVVEVLRRIRQVCLEENGTVITQEAGTFFCRSVKGRSGVLNGKPWTSDSFIELGLKGERSNSVHAIDSPPVATQVLVNRVVIPLLGVGAAQFGINDMVTSFEITEDLVFNFDNVNPETGEVANRERFPQKTGARGPDGSPVGISGINITLSVIFGSVFDSPAFNAGGPYVSVAGTPLNLGESFVLDGGPGVYAVEYLADFNLFEVGEIPYVLDITFNEGFE